MNFTAKKLSLYQAIKLFKDFHGDDPRFIDELEIELKDVFMVMGEADGVLYSARRNGKLERYIHEFNKNSKPLLAVSHDGKQILLIGGNYQVTERGIVDKG